MRARGEGSAAGPRPTGLVERWTLAEQQLTRARAVGDAFRVRLFTGLALVALERSVEDRRN